jgi:cytochrome c biogenesis protein CcdA
MYPLIRSSEPVSAQAAYTLGLMATLFLIGLLAQRELVAGLTGNRARRLGIALWVAIVPLLGGFLLIVVDRIVELLAP